MTKSRKSTTSRILDAMTHCVVELGVTGVSLEVVAERAGVGRQTIYRQFGNRDGLLQSLFVHRFRSIGDTVAALLETCDDFQDAIVKGSVLTVTLIVRDPVYQALSAAGIDTVTELRNLAPGSPSSDLVMLTWRPTLESARAAGELKADLSFEKAAEYISNMHWLLTWRRDLNERGLAALIKGLFLPAFVSSTAPVPGGFKNKR